MKILTVLGARPQFIKAAAMSRVFKNHDDIIEVIIHTGQHYDPAMSDLFFQEMQIPVPKYQLRVAGKLHGEMTGHMLIEIEKIIIDEGPDLVLVYGDTNSTLAGALAAVKLNIPVAHVEAGLRSFNNQMPEETNRIITDRISSILFCPTPNAVGNLLKEGIEKSKIFEVGDVMMDVLRFYREIASKTSTILDSLSLRDKSFLLATIHRAENTDQIDRLDEIFQELKGISKDRIVVIPLHPRTKSKLKRDYSNPNFKIIEPVGYFDMLALEMNCQLIVTDSGGVQKEAYMNNKYCITVRAETEWIELVEGGFNFLANPIGKLRELIDTLWGREFSNHKISLYGDGNSAERIAKIISAGIGLRQ